MRRKILTILCSIIAVMLCVYVFLACDRGGGYDDGDNSDNNYNNDANVIGTYYLYHNNKLDDSLYYVFRNGKWTDADDLTGNYAVNGNKVTLYIDVFGDSEIFVTGAVSGDDITMSDGLVFRKGEDLTSKPKRLSYELNDEETYYKVIGIGTMDGEVVVPETYRGLPVSEIDYRAFQRCTKLTSIEIPESVTVLGEQAFEKCSNLTTAKINGQITELLGNVFDGCTKLVDVYIPKTVTEINYRAFKDCERVQNVYYDGTASSWAQIKFDISASHASTNMGSEEPYWANPISGEGRRLIINDLTVTSCDLGNVNAGAFFQYKYLTSVRAGDVGDYAFYYSSIASLTAKSVGISACEGCHGLKSFSGGGTKIGNNAFLDCTAMTSASLSDELYEIGKSAFAYCEALTEIAIPEPVMFIDEYAFNGTGLSMVVFENANNWAINNNGNLQEIESQNLSVTSNAAKLLSKSDNTGYATYPWNVNFLEFTLNADRNSYSVKSRMTDTFSKITIPTMYNGKSVTKIKSMAFAHCCDIGSIYIPSTIVEVGDDAFYDCTTVIYCESDKTELDFDAGSACPIIWNCKNNDVAANGNSYTVANGILYALKDGKASVERANSNLSGDIVIPSKVSYNGFNYIVSTINNSAFLINKGQFDGAFMVNNITSITIPIEVDKINGRPFVGCRSATLYCEAEKKPLGWSNDWYARDNYVGFAGCPVIWDCNNNDKTDQGSMYVVIDKIRYRVRNGEAEVCSQPQDMFGAIDVVIPHEVTYNDAIYKVTSISERAFLCCTGIASIILPDSITSIGIRAFDTCDRLTIYCELTEAPDGWKKNNWNPPNNPIIWDYKNNDKDTEGYMYAVIDKVRYKLKDGVATMIKQPTNIRGEVVLPSVISYKNESYVVDGNIGNYIFQYCNITSIVIPNHFTYIGWQTFSSCKYLTKVVIPKSVTSVNEYAFEHCSGLTIYCEVESKPNRWSTKWNIDNQPVVWGYENQ